MLFKVVRVREAGWVLPRWRSAMHAPFIGQLEVKDLMDAHVGRATRVARLLDCAGILPIDIPPLYDAVLVSVTSGYMTLTGIERIRDEMTERDYEYAQSWLLMPLE